MYRKIKSNPTLTLVTSATIYLLFSFVPPWVDPFFLQLRLLDYSHTFPSLISYCPEYLVSCKRKCLQRIWQNRKSGIKSYNLCYKNEFPSCLEKFWIVACSQSKYAWTYAVLVSIKKNVLLLQKNAVINTQKLIFRLWKSMLFFLFKSVFC